MPTTIDNLLSRMTLEEKIGQMILASIEVSRMDAGTREFKNKNHIGNVILFGKNCAGRAALAQLNAEIQHTVMAENGLPALIAIDQEGGCVTRLRSEATVFPSAMVIARTGDPANAYKVGRMMGGELRALGINLDCAPVLADVCAAAPAVVFAFGTREEAAAAAQAAEALAAHNPRFCAVCLAEPDALQHYPFAASTVSAWDRTEPAMRAVCRALANPQI